MMYTLLFIGTTELLLISGIALLLFGGKKLPELMRGMGQGVQNFKKGLNEPIEETNEITHDDKSNEKNVNEEERKQSGDQQLGTEG